MAPDPKERDTRYALILRKMVVRSFGALVVFGNADIKQKRIVEYITTYRPILYNPKYHFPSKERAAPVGSPDPSAVQEKPTLVNYRCPGGSFGDRRIRRKNYRQKRLAVQRWYCSTTIPGDVHFCWSMLYPMP